MNTLFYDAKDTSLIISKIDERLDVMEEDIVELRKIDPAFVDELLKHLN